MATLFDTSVWIRHFRKPERDLMEALDAGTLLIHESVVGELALGRIPKPASTLKDLLRLPFAPVVPFKELLNLLQQQRLISKGLSWIDVQIIGSALAVDAEIFTYDRPLARAWGAIKK